MQAVAVRKDQTGEGLYAVRNFAPGDVVVDFGDATRQSERDRYTVEHPAGFHIRHPVLARCAHSCDPNCGISFERMALVALRPIAAGEAIAFDYRTTESVIGHPFACLCGETNCRGWIG